MPHGGTALRLVPPYDDEPVGDWLRRHGQSPTAIERFWSPVLVGALAETVEHASLDTARKVFREGFLASRNAGDLLLPRLPLTEIFNAKLGKRLAERGVRVHLSTPVHRIEGDRRSARAVVLADGERREFDAVVVAVPWRRVRPLLSEELLAALPGLESIEKIEPAAITAVHLWFDRFVVPLPHAVLVGRLSQWVFANCGAAVPAAHAGETPAPQLNIDQPSATQHCQVVISASHRLAKTGTGTFCAQHPEGGHRPKVGRGKMYLSPFCAMNCRTKCSANCGPSGRPSAKRN